MHVSRILSVGPAGEMVMNPIPGEAGTDYPVYTEVPDTGFNCAQQQFLPGIYADIQADCQVTRKADMILLHLL